MRSAFSVSFLPGSGKTTLAKELAPKVPAVRLSPDEWPGMVPIKREDLERWALRFEAPDAAERALFDQAARSTAR